MITSKQNALIKQIRSLSDKKFRDRLGLFVVEGIKPVNEAVALGMPINAIICTEKAHSSLILNGVEAQLVTEEVLKSVSEEVTPQGARALVEKKEQHALLQEKLEKSEGTEDDNAEYIFIGGYIQCLEDILHAKRKEEV